MKSRRDFLKMASAGLAAIASQALPSFKSNALKLTQGGIVPDGKPLVLIEHGDCVISHGPITATDVKLEITDTRGKTYWVDGLSPETAWATTQKRLTKQKQEL